MDVLRQCVIPLEADWHKAPQADPQRIALEAYQEKIA